MRGLWTRFRNRTTWRGRNENFTKWKGENGFRFRLMGLQKHERALDVETLEHDIRSSSSRLDFERLLFWLRLSFLLTPLLLLAAYGWAATRPSLQVEAVVAADSAFHWILLRRFPHLVLRGQIFLRFVDLGATYLALQLVHVFVGNVFYDSAYLLFVVAATATHGRRGSYWIAPGAAAAVLLGRVQLIAAGVIPFHPHQITDSLFYALLFVTTGSITDTLMRRSAEVVALRERQADQAIRESEERYRGLFENATDIVYIHDLAGAFLSLNRAAENVLGYSQVDLQGLAVADVVAPDRLQHAEEMIRRQLTGEGSSTYETELITKDGRRITVEISSQLVQRSGKPVAIQGIGRDVTARKRLEATLTHQALHDALTELPNRALLRDRLQHASRMRRRHGTSFAVLLIDLDRFKEINDTFGHHCGDRVLQEVGRRLQGVLRDSDTIARLGGDEFVILLPATAAAGAMHVAQNALEVLAEPLELEEQLFDVGGSIGIALSPDHGEDGEILLRHVDEAMYVAKREKSGYALYLPDVVH